MGAKWGTEVVGKSETRILDTSTGGVKAVAPVNNLAGLIKRKRADGASADTGPVKDDDYGLQAPAPVNILGAGLVKKKKKGDDKDVMEAPRLTAQVNTTASDGHPTVNVLSAGQVRKKPKVT